MCYDESRRGGARGPWLWACHVPRGELRGARAARVERGGASRRAQHPENPLNGVGLVAPQAV